MKFIHVNPGQSVFNAMIYSIPDVKDFNGAGTYKNDSVCRFEYLTTKKEVAKFATYFFVATAPNFIIERHFNIKFDKSIKTR